MNVSTSYEDYPSFDERLLDPQRHQAVINTPPLVKGVSESNLLLLRWVTYGIVLLAVLCTGWVVFTKGRGA